MKKRWIRHYARVSPKKKTVEVVRQIWEGNPRFRKRAKSEVVKTVTFTEDVPFREYEISVEHFDSRAFQMDDRFYTTTQMQKDYDKDVLKTIGDDALIGFNTEPIEIISLTTT